MKSTNTLSVRRPSFLFGHKVKIIADEKADPEKGTGVVMSCTYGDVTDIDWWREHNLETKVCFTNEGRMNELAGEFEDLTIEEARKAVTEKLKEEGYIFKQEELAAEGRIVNTHERVALRLSTYQLSSGSSK